VRSVEREQKKNEQKIIFGRVIERDHHLMRPANVLDRIPNIEDNIEDTLKGDQDRDLAQRDANAREYNVI